MTRTETSNEHLLYSLFQEVWLDGNVQAIKKYFHPDAKLGGLIPGQVFTRDEYIEWVEQFQQVARMTNPRVVTGFVDPDGRSASEVIVTMTSLNSGKSCDIKGFMVTLIEDGLVTESRSYVDMIHFFEQMGNLPENSTLLMLLGAELR